MYEDDIVTLTEAEMVMAANVGVARRLGSIINKRNTRKHDTTKGEWENDIVGALTEYATARYFNLGWSGAVIGNKTADVGDLVEVRAVWEMHHRLLLRHDDAPKKHMPFVSVCHKGNRFKLRGWAFGVDVMQDKWLDDPTKTGREEAFVYDNAGMEPMKSLREWIEINRIKLW